MTIHLLIHQKVQLNFLSDFKIFTQNLLNKETSTSIYSVDLTMRECWLIFNLEQIRGSRFHSEDDIHETIKEYFYIFQEMDCLSHLMFYKLDYKRVFILKGTTLNTSIRVGMFNLYHLAVPQRFESDCCIIYL